MNHDTFVHVALPVPMRQGFDYRVPAEYKNTTLLPGMRVLVPFGNRQCLGIVVTPLDKSSWPAHQIKSILQVLDEKPVFTQNLWSLLQFASTYYQHPFGEVVWTALPVWLRKQNALTLKKAPKLQDYLGIGGEELPILTPEQTVALQTIEHSLSQFQVHLLDGITGSGKTEIYLHVIAKMLEQEKQSLVLVPEIGLTPQLVNRFRNRFNVPIVVLHSNMTDQARFRGWSLAQQNIAKIIIGTRSAIFTPLENAGVIILDEEHDASYKQQDGFRYSARDLAVRLGQLQNIPIILGSATPSLESFYNAQQQRYQWLKLRTRAAGASIPNITVLNIRGATLKQGLSQELIHAIEQHLLNEKQVLLFINRRGFAPVMMCYGCGWSVPCPHCDTYLVWHRRDKKLRCHYCDFQQEALRICTKCQSHELMPVGVGTERLEQTLQELFPDKKILRIDRDSTQQRKSFNDLLENIHSGTADILIGTQMLAKGHHFPNVTLVGILEVDAGLLSTDFRASERLGQLILQVAGRAGREDSPGEVIIQTRYPQHPLLHTLISDGYEAFAADLLVERKRAQFPPYHYLALIRTEATQLTRALNFLTLIKEKGLALKITSVECHGPIPAPQEKRGDKYRAQLLIQSPQRQVLQKYLRELLLEIEQCPDAKRLRWSVDVDPIDLF